MFDQRLSRTHEATLDLEQTRNPVMLLHVDQLQPGPHQARRDFSGVPKLGQSVLERGVLMPLRVRPLEKDRYEIIAGEQRWRAAQWAAQQRPERAYLPCTITSASSEVARQDGLHENLVRTDLNRYEITQVIVERVAEREGISRDEVRERLIREGNRNGSDPLIAQSFEQAIAFSTLELQLSSFVRFYLPLLELPEDLLEALETRGLPFTLALELRRVSDPLERSALLEQAISGQLSVKALRAQLKTRTAHSKGSVQRTWKQLNRRMKPELLDKLNPNQQAELERLLQGIEKILNN